MAYIPLRSEKSVSELLDKIYSNLSDKQRKAAEAAILKENPALRDFASLKKGTLIRIPKVKNIKPRRTRSVADPDNELLEDYMQRLESFSELLAKNNKQKDKQQKDAQSVLKKSSVKKILDTSAQAKQVADDLNKFISDDGKQRKQDEADTKNAIAALQKDLEKLFK